eukprot:TRINITY_DN1501_c0_g1_i3.p1 TRINITY_DN1501_c0_g1~~TRINITY_DN1501_c0_g1_i3.p1  ORF type:complete len:154 (+),score=18.31 TRINITY_DN1501_c0_g1_i3:1-462(+)
MDRVLLFAIVTDNDTPVYEHDFSQDQGKSPGTDKTPYLQQLTLHASLDSIEDQQWVSKEGTASGFLRNVDRFNRMSVSALVTASSSKLLLLHNEGRLSEESTKSFLSEVAQLYMMIMLNPLHDPDDRITSPAFQAAVTTAAINSHIISGSTRQ